MRYEFNPRIIRSYDIRGIFGESLKTEDAFYLGLKLLALRTQKNFVGRICIGYDGRASSPELLHHLLRGLAHEAVEVIDLGLIATPMLYFAAHNLYDVDIAVMITGSHHPHNYNGFKILVEKEVVFSTKFQELVEIEVRETSWNYSFLHNQESISRLYLQKLEPICKNIKPIKIVWDPGGGSACGILKELIINIPGEHLIINGEIDSFFKAHAPDPSQKENLSQLMNTVQTRGFDLGIAFDGDADRLGVVDAKGNILAGSHLLYLFAKDLLSREPNSSIIVDVKIGSSIIEKIQSLGGIIITSKIGHGFIKAKMKEAKTKLAGEMSGHLFFGEDYFGIDDAIFGACKFLQIVSHNINIIDEALSIDAHILKMPILKISCTNDQKVTFINTAKTFLHKHGIEFNDIDGIKVKNNDSWWLIRASGTEDMVVIIAESKTSEALDQAIFIIDQIVSIGTKVCLLLHEKEDVLRTLIEE